MLRRLALLVFFLLMARTAWAEDGVYIVLTGVGSDDPYHAAAVTLAKHHHTKHLLSFDPAHPEALRDELRKLRPAHVALVVRPEQIEVNAVRRFLRFATTLDDDPFVDFAYGWITGTTADEAVAFVRRIVEAQKKKRWPKRVCRASVGGGSGSRVQDDTYRLGKLSWPMRRLTFVAPDGGHGRDQAFLDEHLEQIEGCGALMLGGHGMPWEIGSGPQAEDIAKLDLFPAVAFNYACYTGVTHVWPQRERERGGYVYRLHEVELERSFALAMIRAGVTGYVGYVNPRPAGPEMTTEFEHVLAGASLGQSRRRDYDKIALGYLGYDEPGIVPPPWVDGERHPRSEVDPVRHMMLDGATGGILYGDPALQPYPPHPEALPMQSVAQRKGDELYVTLTLVGDQAYLWGADPFRRFDAERMAMKLYDRVEIPAGLPEIRSLHVEHATWGGRAIDTIDPVWAIEADQGKRYLHLKANFARSGRGAIEIRMVASPEAPPLDLTKARDCVQLAEQVGEAVLAMRDEIEDPWAYDGKAGVALFLFELADATNDERWREAADALLSEAAASDGDHPGLYVGRAGVGQVALDAWTRTNEERYLTMAKDIAARLGEPKGTDVIAGAAGTGFFLLNLHASTGDEDWLEAALELGAYLAESAEHEDGQASWPIASDRERVYIGFSHGAAGIGTFLLHLARVTGEAKWLELAREAATWVIAQAEEDGAGGWRWPKQPPPVEPDVRLQWCHGSPGIGLFFLALADLTGEAEHEAALQRCVAANLGGGRTARANGCYCHGKAGNGDCLLEVWRTRRDARLLDAARTWAGDLHSNGRVRTTLGERAYGPGLMTGLSGIGHFLLRLADPEGVSPAFLIAGGGPDAVLEAVRVANQAALRPGASSDRAIAKIEHLGLAGFRAACRLIAAGEGHYRTFEVLSALYQPGSESSLIALADGPKLPGYGRWTALEALAVANTPEVRTYLVDRLAKERDAGLFMATAKALGRLEDPRAVPLIATQLLRFEEGWTGVEPHLVGALGALGPDAVSSLVAFVGHEEATREAGLSRALGALERLDETAARRAAKDLRSSSRFESLGERLQALVRRLAP